MKTLQNKPKEVSDTGLTSRMPRVRIPLRPRENKDQSHIVSLALSAQLGTTEQDQRSINDTITRDAARPNDGHRPSDGSDPELLAGTRGSWGRTSHLSPSRAMAQLNPGSCLGRYVFDACWAREAPAINWAPLVCTLPKAHEGEHLDESERIPWLAGSLDRVEGEPR